MTRQLRDCCRNGLAGRKGGWGSQEQLALAAALPLDPSVRYRLAEKLYRLKVRIEFMDHIAGQMLNHFTHVGMTPKLSQAQHRATRYGTYRSVVQIAYRSVVSQTHPNRCQPNVRFPPITAVSNWRSFSNHCGHSALKSWHRHCPADGQ